MVTVVYHNGTIDRFPVDSQAEAESMADTMASQMGTEVKSISYRGMCY